MSQEAVISAVGPNRMELIPGRLRKGISNTESIRRRGSDVIMYCARAMPPWMSVAVVVSDGHKTGLATVPLWTRRRVGDVIEEAGFNITERTTWFQRGYELMAFG
jgi:hypothetical protein